MTHLPKIIIKPVAPENQRFFECGDWFYDAEDDTLTIFVSRMADYRSELAVAVHEAVEAVMCLAADIPQTEIDYFDHNFYKTHDDATLEAGNDKAAPYFNMHVAATSVEREVCLQTWLDWKKHEENVME